MKEIDIECPIATSIHIIGGKWRLRIVSEISLEKRRFGELKRLIPDISEKMLIQELKTLCEYEILNRHAYPEVPPRVEYTLTDLGKEILPIIKQMSIFGEKVHARKLKLH